MWADYKSARAGGGIYVLRETDIAVIYVVIEIAGNGHNI